MLAGVLKFLLDIPHISDSDITCCVDKHDDELEEFDGACNFN